MRTSNKILLTAFLTVIVLTAVVPVVIIAKYKSGDIVLSDRQQPGSIVHRHALENVRYIYLSGVENCTIISSDSARMEIWDNNPMPVKFRFAGDTLLINGDSVIKEENRTVTFKSNQPVVLYLHETGLISATRSHIYLSGSLDSAKAPSYNINAFDNSTVDIGAGQRNDTVTAYFDRLQIDGRQSSTVAAMVHTAINELQVAMTGSSFSDQGAMLNTFKLSTDQQSAITLKKESIKRLQLIPNP